MMKLVVSFDEMGIDNGFVDDDIAVACKKVESFLENQFPNWDIMEAFSTEYHFDYDNMECHIDMFVV